MDHSVLILAIDSATAIDCANQMAADGDHVYLIRSGCMNAAVDDRIVVTDTDIDAPVCAEETVCHIFDAEGRIDILVFGANGHLTGNDEPTEDILDSVEYNINCCRGLIEAALPKMRHGGLKRIAMLSERAASITLCTEAADDLTEPLTQAGLHMLLRIYFNQLRREGFTFRCYTSEGSRKDAQYLTPMRYVNMRFSYDPDSPTIRNEEDRLVMRDPEFREIPW